MCKSSSQHPLGFVGGCEAHLVNILDFTHKRRYSVPLRSWCGQIFLTLGKWDTMLSKITNPSPPQKPLKNSIYKKIPFLMEYNTYVRKDIKKSRIHIKMLEIIILASQIRHHFAYPYFLVTAQDSKYNFVSRSSLYFF